MQSLKNDTYTQVAAGFHEAASQTLLLSSSLLFVGAMLGFVLYTVARARDARATYDDLVVRVENLSKGQTPPSPSLEEIKQCLSKISFTRISRPIYVLIVCVALWAPSKVVSAVRTNYVNQAVTHFEQLLTIVRPHLAEGDEKQIRSQFAQIHSRNDYVSVITRLRQVAEIHGQSTPQFSVW
jgi:hypothetical protein